MKLGELREVGHRVVDLLARFLGEHPKSDILDVEPHDADQALRRAGFPSPIPALRRRFWLSWNRSFCLTAPMSDIQVIWVSLLPRRAQLECIR